MAIYEHETAFAGKLVQEWDPATGISDPQATIYRITLDYDEMDSGQHWSDKFALFLDDPAAHQVTGIVVGNWQQWANGRDIDPTAAPIVEALVAARERLPHLTALFLGDITVEEWEISWILQSDVAPLLNAYPALEHFGVRGGNGLRFGVLHHERLRSLIIESGGLPAQVVRDVVASTLPALHHLELWMGDEGYGGDATIDDVAPLLFDTPFPALRSLALRNSEITDEIAFAIAKAPVLEHINVLDLSLGTLSDLGAAALLECPAIGNLEQLILHHHYCSDGVTRQLVDLGKRLGIAVDVSDPQEADTWDGQEHRFVAVSE
jgi:NOL1/NOP2/fmu family ribosome biogenesis protein